VTQQKARKCTCECGGVSYAVPDKPLFRMFCHCTICQKFNDAAHGDIFVYRASDIERPEEGLVNFDTYRPPPNVQRGKCAACSKPAIEVLDTPLIPSLILVPGNMHNGHDCLPAPKGHVFYQSRIEDIDDSLPKHSGYLKSQLVFGKHLLMAFAGRA
jgi:hypothetical protein